MTMELREADDAGALAREAAEIVAETVANHPGALVMAATGETPMGTYAELVRQRAGGALDSSGMRIAQLDEYLGIGPEDPRSLFGWMHRALVEPLGIGPDRVIRFDSQEPDADLAAREYDARIQAAGGINLAILGLGVNGHLGFNEPPSDASSPTRTVHLSPDTLASNAAYWGDRPVPTGAITAGMGVILSARRILLLVSGGHKAAVLTRVLESDPDPWLPASQLHAHPNTIVLADRTARGA
ncbi:MAG: glucosamine-6-phosphate deaminase [Candidatus Limnocylindria bacterium]